MNCTHCNDTGSLSKDLFGFLDCTKCDAAGERVKLEHWANMNLSGAVEFSADLWLIYQHGKQSAAKPSEFASLNDDELRGEIDACHAIGSNEEPYVAELERRATSAPTQTQQG